MELRDALNDSRVDHVVLAQIPGGYSLLEEEFPENGLWLDGRTVVMEGEGPGRVYMDVRSFVVSWVGVMMPPGVYSCEYRIHMTL